LYAPPGFPRIIRTRIALFDATINAGRVCLNSASVSFPDDPLGSFPLMRHDFGLIDARTSPPFHEVTVYAAIHDAVPLHADLAGVPCATEDASRSLGRLNVVHNV
jgi:hypothetical protein